jgi:hypothetical protein
VFTFAGRWGPDALLDADGNASPSSSVSLRLPDGVTPATTYSDETMAVEQPQPISPDAFGNLTFFAVPGSYVLVVTTPGAPTVQVPVVVPIDPRDLTAEQDARAAGDAGEAAARAAADAAETAARIAGDTNEATARAAADTAEAAARELADDALADDLADETAARTAGDAAAQAAAAAAQATADAAVPQAALGVTVATLTGGKVPTDQLPSLAVTDVFPVADQAAMLALAAERGDLALRGDNGRTYALAADDPTVLANWLELPAIGAVTSVNGQVGAVVLPADAAAGTPSLRTLGNGATQAAAGNDPRLSDQRVPVDGSVTPAKLSFDPATQGELDAEAAARANADAVEAAAREDGDDAAAAALAAHAGDTTDVHGIADTAALMVAGDPPTAHAPSHDPEGSDPYDPIFVSPDGTRFRLVVANDGTPSMVNLAIVVRDTASRANQTPLGNADTGQAWASLEGVSLSVIAGQIGPASNATRVDVIDAGITDARYTVTWATITGTSRQIARVVDSANYVFVDSLGRVGEVVAGVSTIFGTMDNADVAPGDVIAMELDGDDVTVMRNGVQEFAGVVTPNGGTRYGLRVSGSAADRFDDVEVRLL